METPEGSRPLASHEADNPKQREQAGNKPSPGVHRRSRAGEAAIKAFQRAVSANVMTEIAASVIGESKQNLGSVTSVVDNIESGRRIRVGKVAREWPDQSVPIVAG